MPRSPAVQDVENNMTALVHSNLFVMILKYQSARHKKLNPGNNSEVLS
jgi:hypothetical protein